MHLTMFRRSNYMYCIPERASVSEESGIYWQLDRGFLFQSWHIQLEIVCQA